MDTTPAGRREWVGLAVLALPLLLVSMDVSVLYFAVPFISQDIGATATQQLWIFDVYGFVLAGLLITMGALGDRVGRRRLLVCGAAAFGAASVLAAYATTPEMLIAARAVLGVGGATLMPSTLALIRTMFQDEGQRRKAIAVWTAVVTGGVSLGPVMSGLLLEHFWWGSVFLVNLPFMVLLLVLAPMLLPEHRNPAAGRFDLLSSVLSLASLLPVIHGVKTGAADGFGVEQVAEIAAGLAVGAVFLRRQRRPGSMIDLGLFRHRRFSGAMVTNVVAMFAMTGYAVSVTQYLQLVQGLSPLTAALWSLAPSVVVAAAAPLAQALAPRLGVPAVASGALVLSAAGFGVLSRLESHGSLVVPLAGCALIAAGLVAVMTLVAEIVVGAVGPERAGAASAVMETGSELGGALGIAVLGSIGTAAFRGALPLGVPEIVRTDGLPGALEVAARVGGAADVVEAARDAFTHGVAVVAVSGVGIMLTAAVLAAILLRERRAVVECAQPAEPVVMMH